MRLVLISLLIIATFVSCSSADNLVLTKTMESFGATHNIPIENLGDACQYWNLDWKGRAPQLYGEIVTVNVLYTRSHAYILGQTECDDRGQSRCHRSGIGGLWSWILGSGSS